jgi:hypothetical protein
MHQSTQTFVILRHSELFEGAAFEHLGSVGLRLMQIESGEAEI